MGLREFTAYQPSCDAPDETKPDGVCGHESPSWFSDQAAAVDDWREADGWTDGTTFVCFDHLDLPHPFLPHGGRWYGSESDCDRCGLARSEHSEGATE